MAEGGDASGAVQITKTLIVVILDESGSMEVQKREVIGGYNEFVETQRTVQNDQGRLLLVKFNSKTSVVHSALPLADVPLLTEENFCPGLKTALHDAVLDGIRIAEGTLQKDERVVVLIFTDGKENYSKKATEEEVKNSIAAKGALGNWTFAYIGENPEGWAKSMGQSDRATPNVMSYDLNEQGANFKSASASTRRMRTTGVKSMPHAFFVVQEEEEMEKYELPDIEEPSFDVPNEDNNDNSSSLEVDEEEKDKTTDGGKQVEEKMEKEQTFDTDEDERDEIGNEQDEDANESVSRFGLLQKQMGIKEQLDMTKMECQDAKEQCGMANKTAKELKEKNEKLDEEKTRSIEEAIRQYAKTREENEKLSKDIEELKEKLARGEEELVNKSNEHLKENEMLKELIKSKDEHIETLKQICETEKKRVAEIDDHGKLEMDRKKTKKSNKVFICETCGKELTNESAFSRHKAEHIKKLSCTNCPKTFKRKHRFTEHLKLCNANVIPIPFDAGLKK